MAREIGFLRQIAHGGTGLHEAGPAIGDQQPGGDFQQGRFARTIAPDEANPITSANREFSPLQQFGAAETGVDILE